MEKKEVSQVRGGQAVKCFVGEEEHFKVDAVFDGEPVERLEDRSDMITEPGGSEQAGGRVLYHL